MASRRGLRDFDHGHSWPPVARSSMVLAGVARTVERLGAERRVRWVALGAIVVGFLAIAILAFASISARQVTTTFADSQIYVELAHTPVTLDLLFQAKPFFVPFLYRLLDVDLARIVM